MILAKGQADSLEIGEMKNIRGYTLDKDNLDTLVLVTIEVFNAGSKLAAIQSDLDGVFIYSFCTNELVSDTLIFRVLGVGYLMDTFEIDYRQSDFNLNMTKDPQELVTNERLLDINNKMLMFYEPEFFTPLSLEDFGKGEEEKYRHYCTGEIKTYNDISFEGLDSRNWIRITTKE